MTSSAPDRPQPHRLTAATAGVAFVLLVAVAGCSSNSQPGADAGSGENDTQSGIGRLPDNTGGSSTTGTPNSSSTSGNTTGANPGSGENDTQSGIGRSPSP